MITFLFHALGAYLSICAFLDGLHQYDYRERDSDISVIVLVVGALGIALVLI